MADGGVPNYEPTTESTIPDELEGEKGSVRRANSPRTRLDGRRGLRELDGDTIDGEARCRARGNLTMTT